MRSAVVALALLLAFPGCAGPESAAVPSSPSAASPTKTATPPLVSTPCTTWVPLDKELVMERGEHSVKPPAVGGGDRTLTLTEFNVTRPVDSQLRANLTLTWTATERFTERMEVGFARIEGGGFRFQESVEGSSPLHLQVTWSNYTAGGRIVVWVALSNHDYPAAVTTQQQTLQLTLSWQETC